MRQREEEIAGLENVHNAMKSQYERRIEGMEAKLMRFKEKNKQLEHRRALDLEGFTNDITILRKQLAAVDRKLHQMRLIDRLERDERLDALLRYLQKKAPGLGTVSENESKGSGSVTSEMAAELGKIKGSILGLESRLISTKGAVKK